MFPTATPRHRPLPQHHRRRHLLHHCPLEANRFAGCRYRPLDHLRAPPCLARKTRQCLQQVLVAGTPYRRPGLEIRRLGWSVSTRDSSGKCVGPEGILTRHDELDLSCYRRSVSVCSVVRWASLYWLPGGRTAGHLVRKTRIYTQAGISNRSSLRKKQQILDNRSTSN